MATTLKSACDRCKHHKLACDGVAPCSRCSRAGHAQLCNFSLPKKRGRPANVVSDTDNPQDMVAIAVHQPRDAKQQKVSFSWSSNDHVHAAAGLRAVCASYPIALDDSTAASASGRSVTDDAGIASLLCRNDSHPAGRLCLIWAAVGLGAYSHGHIARALQCFEEASRLVGPVLTRPTLAGLQALSLLSIAAFMQANDAGQACSQSGTLVTAAYGLFRAFHNSAAAPADRQQQQFVQLSTAQRFAAESSGSEVPLLFQLLITMQALLGSTPYGTCLQVSLPASVVAHVLGRGVGTSQATHRQVASDSGAGTRVEKPTQDDFCQLFCYILAETLGDGRCTAVFRPACHLFILVCEAHYPTASAWGLAKLVHTALLSDALTSASVISPPSTGCCDPGLSDDILCSLAAVEGLLHTADVAVPSHMKASAAVFYAQLLISIHGFISARVSCGFHSRLSTLCCSLRSALEVHAVVLPPELQVVTSCMRTVPCIAGCPDVDEAQWRASSGLSAVGEYHRLCDNIVQRALQLSSLTLPEAAVPGPRLDGSCCWQQHLAGTPTYSAACSLPGSSSPSSSSGSGGCGEWTTRQEQGVEGSYTPQFGSAVEGGLSPRLASAQSCALPFFPADTALSIIPLPAGFGHPLAHAEAPALTGGGSQLGMMHLDSALRTSTYDDLDDLLS